MKKLKANKKRLTLEERLPLILSFLLPVVIMGAICAAKGIYPFGSMSFLRTDLYHQYCPFYTELSNRLKEGGSLTYAWDIGLGSNYLALIAYYLCCPTQILLVILPESLSIEYITLMIILKIGLCGYTMAKYLSVKHKSRNLGIVFFAICYALSGYLAAYSWNIMWLDVILLAPLAMLGVERLVKEQKPILYCVVLAISIITNYYISIMLCMFLVIYFIGCLFMVPTNKPSFYLKAIGRFALYSIIAGGISAVIVVPAAYALFTTASANTTFPTDVTSYFSVIEMLARHFTFVECETGLDHWPNIYCGVAIILFLPMYFLNKKISYKEKIVKAFILVLMLIGFSFNVFNYIWHGFHYPNSLPARQSYLYIWLILSMGYEGFRGLKKISKGTIAGIFFGVSGFIFLCEAICDETEIGTEAIYLTLAFVALYALILYLYRLHKLKAIVAFTILLSLLVVELGLNTTQTSVFITDRNVYKSNLVEYKDLLASIEDEGFYRVEKHERRTKNDGAYVGYNSASIFSSTTNAAVSEIYKKLGLEGNTNAYSFSGATPFTASLLSVKYILSDTELPESTLYRLQAEENNVYLYENLYTLPLGFMIPEDTDALWSYTSSDPARAQNSLVDILDEGSTELFSSIPGTNSGNEFSTSVNERSHVFVYIENSSAKDVITTVDGEVHTFYDVDRGYLVDLGYCEAGANITVASTEEDDSISAVAYTFDDDAFISIYNKLATQSFELESMTNTLTNTSLSGTVKATADGYLLMSIPYDKGWTVKVDGEVVEAEGFSDALMMIPVSAGEHTIEMSYVPEGLFIGAVASGTSIILFAICCIVRNAIKKSKKDEDDEINEELEGDEPEGIEENDGANASADADAKAGDEDGTDASAGTNANGASETGLTEDLSGEGGSQSGQEGSEDEPDDKPNDESAEEEVEAGEWDEETDSEADSDEIDEEEAESDIETKPVTEGSEYAEEEVAADNDTGNDNNIDMAGEDDNEVEKDGAESVTSESIDEDVEEFEPDDEFDLFDDDDAPEQSYKTKDEVENSSSSNETNNVAQKPVRAELPSEDEILYIGNKKRKHHSKKKGLQVESISDKPIDSRRKVLEQILTDLDKGDE